ncbi:MAG: hypothetical protein COA86_01095 [Kangiella sp.]|nr:MAG: hypothetical protein COA86_01095 [Kangiella sp.]
MYLSNFVATGLRNLSKVQISLSSELNIIEGNNAAGKSSLLEGIGLLVSGRSFRTTKNNQIISHNQKEISLFAQFDDSTKIGVSYGHTKSSRKIRLNGNNLNALSKMASIFPVQTLSPESYHLIDSGPGQRRKHLDWLLFHVEHSYKSDWQSFNKVLKQRNSFLRALNGTKSHLDDFLLNSWNLKFVELADVINSKRKNLLSQLLDELRIVLDGMDLCLEGVISVEYHSGNGKTNLVDKLHESLYLDVSRGSTSFGPHKADVKLKIGGRDVKDVLSRGQKKMLINALYLSQTTLLKKLSGKDSLFIIDDFSSELDSVNQLQLVLALKDQKNVQVFISCLDSLVLKPLIKEYNNVKMFHVKHGVISEVTLPT